MHTFRQITVLFLCLGLFAQVNGKNYVPPEGEEKEVLSPTAASSTTNNFRMDCAESTSQVDLNINNVRARLLGGGDLWWDFDDAKYIVPNVDPASGIPPVSSIFAGAVWLGGFDDGDNLRLAAQTFRDTGNDFWPGPLDPATGETNDEDCLNWDKHFTVHGDTIETHLNKALSGNPINCAGVPKELKGWPGIGNPHFAGIHGFSLPNQSLAPFFDFDGDGIYDPCNGDFPVIEVRGCEPGSAGGASLADQMIFWIYNDNGGTHTQTNAVDNMRMEIQVQAFGYATNDELNDQTFYRYKLLNYANQSLDSTYFAQWIDPDLGCPADDYIGCDIGRSLAVVYNEGTVDGAGGGCDGVETYGAEVPILGVDYFRGPLDEFGNEIGMSSFTYHNRDDLAPNPATGDPVGAQEHYNFMSGTWRDGSPFVFGGNGYNPGGTPIPYVFPDSPSDGAGWSMCTGGVVGGDIRTIQASGPFRLDPGATNELIIGVVWVPDVLYPCPDFSQILEADDLSQALFDNCFDIQDGPDAPDLCLIELDQEIIISLVNDTLTSNNAFEEYNERGLNIPQGTVDSLYVFEGYEVYQLSGADVSAADLDDPEKARLIFQSDVKNGVDKVFNWERYPDASLPQGAYFVPELMVEGADDGIGHTLRVTQDQFATANSNLVNHRKYYFMAIAYGYNNYQTFDPDANLGQDIPYFPGRRNIKVYTAIPRIPDPEFFGTTLNAQYGDQPEITRVDGIGNGGLFVDVVDGTHDEILANNMIDEITYKQGAGPVNVFVYDPLRAQPGDFVLSLVDRDLNDAALDTATFVKWILTETNSGNTWSSEGPIDTINEQLIPEIGLAVSVGQVFPAEEIPFEGNGFITSPIEYAGEPIWYDGIADEDGGGDFTNFMQTGPLQEDEAKDPNQEYRNAAEGMWYPYTLANYRTTDGNGNPYQPYVSPAWIDQTFGNIIAGNNFLGNLNNVDVVITPDPNKWSRCVVLETTNANYAADGFPVEGSATHMDLRTDPSVNKDGTPDGDGTGKSWFPGYAVDVITGERLNIFFGEASMYSDASGIPDFPTMGGDMIFNPTDDAFVDLIPDGQFSAVSEFVFGGHHHIYVHNSTYDGCETIHSQLVTGSAANKILAFRDISWCSMSMLAQGQELLPLSQNLIPSEVTFKLRANSVYDYYNATGSNNGHPEYTFSLDGLAVQTDQADVAEKALDLINVVPNPYYGFSDYEQTQFDNLVKITNLPPKATVTIYSLDGKFIRRYDRDEVSESAKGQIVTAIEWDLKNNKQIPVSSGVYLIHVQVPGVGERTLKWFGINRQFDTNGL